MPHRRRPARPAAAHRPGRWLRDVHAGPAGRRVFDVYVPAGRRRGRLPVVLLLHGCLQTADEFAHASRFPQVADRNGVLLVVAHQERYHQPRRCWRWYEAAHQERDAGEPGILAGIVAQVLDERERWRADPARVYVAGISAGGAMALILAAAYPDVFAAAGVHSAPPYRAATRLTEALTAMAGRGSVPHPAAGDRMAPVVCLQGSEDTVVRPANGDRVIEQWLAHRAAADHGATRTVRSRRFRGRTADGTRYAVRRWYTARGRVSLEYWSVQGLEHAWSGGQPGGSFADPRGPRAATVMWRFFRRHRLAGRPRRASALRQALTA
ncbi:MAG: PHB depolymerase family esterase [Pseudonocardia sp.]